MKKRWHTAILLILVLTQCKEKAAEQQVTDAPNDAVSIEYIAHACFLLKAGDKQIMIDPYASKVWLSYDFPNGISADAAFITHPHYDHDGGIFRGKRPSWMFDIPFYQDPKEYQIGGFNVKGIIGKHADPYGKEFGQMNTIWKITVNGIVFAHWGDNGPLSDENYEDLKDVDVLLIPMDGDFHIIPPEAYAKTFEILEPKVIIPMHYRIPELESDPESPSNLGEIGPFLEVRPSIATDSTNIYLPDVKYLQSNIFTLTAKDLPKKSIYYVFKHSPSVVSPTTP